MTPIWGIFNMIGSLCYTLTQSNWSPFSAEKISLSLSHLVPEILWPKVGLIFHQNVLVNRFDAFCINFQSNWPPFSLLLDLFDLSFSQNLRSDWVQFLFACWVWLPNIWWSTPPPLPPGEGASTHPLCKPRNERIRAFLLLCIDISCSMRTYQMW